MNWVLQKLIEWLIANLTEQVIKDWADKLKAFVLPWLTKQKDHIIAELRKAAADSSTPIDDVAVDAFDKFLNALLPKP